jgi:hypothetical protein
MSVVTEVAGVADEDGREADEAVQERDELGHRRHRDAGGHERADAGADDQGEHKVRVGVHAAVEQRGHDGDAHADEPVRVAATGRHLTGQPAQTQDEQNRREDVGDGEESVFDLQAVHRGALTSETSSACAA